MIQCMAFAVHTWNCKKQGLVTDVYICLYVYIYILSINKHYLVCCLEMKVSIDLGLAEVLKICQLNLKL